MRKRKSEIEKAAQNWQIGCSVFGWCLTQRKLIPRQAGVNLEYRLENTKKSKSCKIDIIYKYKICINDKYTKYKKVRNTSWNIQK